MNELLKSLITKNCKTNNILKIMPNTKNLKIDTNNTTISHWMVEWPQVLGEATTMREWSKETEVFNNIYNTKSH